MLKAASLLYTLKTAQMNAANPPITGRESAVCRRFAYVRGSISFENHAVEIGRKTIKKGGLFRYLPL